MVAPDTVFHVKVGVVVLIVGPGEAGVPGDITVGVKLVKVQVEPFIKLSKSANVPLKTSKSTGRLIPETVPVSEYWSKTQVCPYT